MDFSPVRSERITAIVSTIVAVAILAGGVTAYQSHNAPVDDVVQLESDLRFQLEVAFRHNPNERAARLKQLQEVSQVWHQSPRNEADHAKLASWLLEATIRSMPGSIKQLPSIPVFGEHVEQPPELLVPAAQNLPSVDAEKLDLSSQVPTLAPKASPRVLQPTVVSAASTTVDSAITDAALNGTVNNELLTIEIPTTQVTQQQSTFAVTPTVAPVRINLTELSARVAGYHQGLDEVESALLTLDRDDYQALALQICQLEEMTRDYHFVKLYHEALSEQERKIVTSPRPMTATLAEIERRLDRSEAVSSDDFLEEFDSSNQDQIAQLRRQLSEVAERVDWK